MSSLFVDLTGLLIIITIIGRTLTQFLISTINNLILLDIDKNAMARATKLFFSSQKCTLDTLFSRTGSLLTARFFITLCDLVGS